MTEHGSPLRSLMGQSDGSYRPIATLDEARLAPDAIVVLEGDDGGQIYLTCEARLVRANERELNALLVTIDEVSWPGNSPDMRRISYEAAPRGGRIAGGMGGAYVTTGLWLHPRLEQTGWRPEVERILFGAEPST